MASPNKPNGSSSDDLERARALSRSLMGEPAASGSAPVTSSPYVSFGPPRPLAPPAPAAPPAPVMIRPRPVSAPATNFGTAEWDVLLDACLKATNAELSMIADPQGLVIASCGSTSLPVEGIASHLLLAFEQADRSSAAPTLSLSAETERGTIHGIRLAQPDGTFLLLALVIPGGLSPERQSALWSVLTRLTQPRTR